MPRCPILRTTVASLTALTVATLAAACGEDPAAPGQYDDLPIAETLAAPSLSAPVDVVRDEYGIPHIHATTIEDAAYANGWIMASDRLPQMQLFRYTAAGRIAELFGGLQQNQIDNDIKMRLHRMGPLAQASFDELAASNDPNDRELVRYLERFSDGINAFADELADGRRQLDPTVTLFFDPTRFQPWTPVDSLALGRLQTYALSHSDHDVRITRVYQRAREVFSPDATDPALARRAGLGYDMFSPRPLDTVATIDGWPNVDPDSGSRAKPRSPRSTTRRPTLPNELLERALIAAAPPSIPGVLTPGRPNGSNNWIVGPSLAGGKALLANDTHLPLTNPSIWYPLHVTVPGVTDFAGIAFPGLPAIQLGHNGHLAWGGTVVVHDVTDYYHEQIHACADGAGDCVTFKGAEVKLETREEVIQYGALGTILGEVRVTYETVPHHGPILPDIANHDVVPRTGGDAISVRFTGHEPTFEVRAMYLLTKAQTVEEGVAALDHWAHGAQNWVLVDDAGNFGWTSTARVPLRSPGCTSFHATDNPDGVAPFLIAPGDGSCEWEGWMDPRYIPHAYNPEQGYLATANSDPVGETFDGDALNGPEVDGRPLFVSALYDPGFRTGRITRRLETLKAAGAPITLEDLGSIQADGHSNFGEIIAPHIVTAATALADERATPGTHADLAAFATALAPARANRLASAAELLSSWSYEAAAGVEGNPSAAEIADAAATSLFNAFAVEYLRLVFGDEVALVGESIESNMHPRMLREMFEHPEKLHSGIAIETGDPVVCDDLTTDGTIESCRVLMLVALNAALDWLETDGFGSADPNDWRWGRLHTVTLDPLTPQDELNVPSATETNPDWIGGYPRHGDQFSVDSPDPDYDDHDFRYGHGPAMRHLTEFPVGGPPRTLFALPGGATFDTTSPHYRDLMDRYWHPNTYFEFPWSVAQVKEHAETRVRFTQ